MRFILLCLTFLLCVGCAESNLDKTPQEFFNTEIKHSNVIDSTGHSLILHEIGIRGMDNYSFSIEHSPVCKKCYDIYD